MIIFGKNEISQGASSDLESVTNIAREMVTRFGFSKLGPISLMENNNEIFRQFILKVCYEFLTYLLSFKSYFLK